MRVNTTMPSELLYVIQFILAKYHAPVTTNYDQSPHGQMQFKDGDRGAARSFAICVLYGTLMLWTSRSWEIRLLVDDHDHVPFLDWFKGLRDARAMVAIN